jgi:hypothetical protein
VEFFREHLASTVAPSTIHEFVRARQRRGKRGVVLSGEQASLMRAFQLLTAGVYLTSSVPHTDNGSGSAFLALERKNPQKTTKGNRIQRVQAGFDAKNNRRQQKATRYNKT